jgi:hypothetical protein
MYRSFVCRGVPRGGVQTPLPPPKFRSYDKAEPNSQFRRKYIRNNLTRIRVPLICKLSGTPDYGATAPRSPFSLPSVLNWICWTPPNKIPVYATVSHWRTLSSYWVLHVSFIRVRNWFGVSVKRCPWLHSGKSDLNDKSHVTARGENTSG